MQVSEVLKGDPTTLATLLNSLAALNTIQIVQKTGFQGRFITVYDNVGGVGQVAEVLRGDPDAIVVAIDALIFAGKQIDVLTQTFSGGFYVVVYQ